MGSRGGLAAPPGEPEGFGRGRGAEQRVEGLKYWVAASPSRPANGVEVCGPLAAREPTPRAGAALRSRVATRSERRPRRLGRRGAGRSGSWRPWPGRSAGRRRGRSPGRRPGGIAGGARGRCRREAPHRGEEAAVLGQERDGDALLGAGAEQRGRAADAAEADDAFEVVEGQLGRGPCRSTRTWTVWPCLREVRALGGDIERVEVGFHGSRVPRRWSLGTIVVEECGRSAARRGAEPARGGGGRAPEASSGRTSDRARPGACDRTRIRVRSRRAASIVAAGGARGSSRRRRGGGSCRRRSRRAGRAAGHLLQAEGLGAELDAVAVVASWAGPACTRRAAGVRPASLDDVGDAAEAQFELRRGNARIVRVRAWWSASRRGPSCAGCSPRR